MSRAAFVGACFGALHGAASEDTDEYEGGVPLAWVSLLHDGASILSTARRVVELRRTIARKPDSYTNDASIGA